MNREERISTRRPKWQYYDRSTPVSLEVLLSSIPKGLDLRPPKGKDEREDLGKYEVRKLLSRRWQRSKNPQTKPKIGRVRTECNLVIDNPSFYRKGGTHFVYDVDGFHPESKNNKSRFHPYTVVYLRVSTSCLPPSHRLVFRLISRDPSEKRDPVSTTKVFFRFSSPALFPFVRDSFAGWNPSQNDWSYSFLRNKRFK